MNNPNKAERQKTETERKNYEDTDNPDTYKKQSGHT